MPPCAGIVCNAPPKRRMRDKVRSFNFIIWDFECWILCSVTGFRVMLTRHGGAIRRARLRGEF